MLIGKSTSINGVAIRLTQERWLHIILSHLEMTAADFTIVLKTIENPDYIFVGVKDEFRVVKESSSNKWIVVIYKEVSSSDGFVITAYITSDLNRLKKRKIIWSKQS